MTAEVIDCARRPFVPLGYDLQSHQQQEAFVWDPSRIEFRSVYEMIPPSKRELCWSPSELYEKLSESPVCNANVLDYLNGNPREIPEDCAGKWLFFLATTYKRRNDGYLYIRYLRQSGFWGYDTLGWCGVLHRHYYIALYAR